MIIGVDHGYSAMKTAHICFPSGIVRYEHEPYTNRGVLRIEGKYYVCGTGRQPLLRTKTVYCKIELPKVANGNWRMLHLQIGESCKAFARSAQERCSA